MFYFLNQIYYLLIININLVISGSNIKMVNLVFHSNDVMYPHVLEYIYDNYKDKINDIVYKNDSNLPRYCYRSRMMKDAPSIKSIVPYECDFELFKK